MYAALFISCSTAIADMDTHNRLLEASARHTEILRRLEETKAAASALATNRARHKDAKRRLAGANHKLGKLAEEQSKLESKHEGMQTSTMKRLSAYMAGKRPDDKAGEYERRLCATSEGVTHTKAQISTLSEQIDALDSDEKRLSALADEHEHLEAELDAMYRNFFKGARQHGRKCLKRSYTNVVCVLEAGVVTCRVQFPGSLGPGEVARVT